MADENHKELPKIRTLKTDAEIFIKEKGLSRLDIERSAYMAGAGKGITKLKLKFSLRKIVLFSASFVIMAVAAYFLRQSVLTPAEGPSLEEIMPFKSFLFNDGEKLITINETNPGALTQALNEERKKSLRVDTIIYFPISILTRGGEIKFASAQDLVKLLAWQAPGVFLEAMLPDFNTLIAYGREKHDIVFILKTRNFERALAGLFAWEKTMWFDFKIFMDEEAVKNIGEFRFADETIKNHDARVLKNTGGKSILAYSIFNKELVIISISREGLSATLDRLITLPPR